MECIRAVSESRRNSWSDVHVAAEKGVAVLGVAPEVSMSNSGRKLTASMIVRIITLSLLYLYRHICICTP